MDLSNFKLTVATVSVAKKGATSNPYRLMAGNFAVQPTGGYPKGAKGKDKVYFTDKAKFNWTYCWFGMYDNNGQHVAGFSMDNVRMLALVESGVLPKGMRDAFELFATEHSDQAVLNADTLERIQG